MRMEEYRNALLAAGRSHGTVKHACHTWISCSVITPTCSLSPEPTSSVSSRTGGSARRPRRASRCGPRTSPSTRGPSPRAASALTRPTGCHRSGCPARFRSWADAEVQLGLVTATLDESAMILLGRLAGLRLSEIATLHTKHREYDVLRVTGKGEKQRMVPINDDLMHALLELEEERAGGYYFPGRYGGHMHPASVNKIITRRLGTNPHSLWHAAATSAYRGTRDLRAVQDFLGHSSLATTERDLHVGLGVVPREVVDAV